MNDIDGSHKIESLSDDKVSEQEQKESDNSSFLYQTKQYKNSMVKMSSGANGDIPKRKEIAKAEKPRPTISVLTYNIWFDDKYLMERTAKIIQMIKQNACDFVCLQEVKPETYQLIKQELSTIYDIFQSFISEGFGYGSVVMCKKSRCAMAEAPYYYDFPVTQMGRKLVGCGVTIKDGSIKNNVIHVMTTHLESMTDNAEARNHQFNTIIEATKNTPNCIVAGDFNICSVKEKIEANISSSDLSDVWVNIGCPNNTKYTYDSKTNPNIGGRYQSRLDRILYKFGFNHTIKSLELIGTNSTSHEIMVPPSDHFGLIATFYV